MMKCVHAMRFLEQVLPPELVSPGIGWHGPSHG
jgi:hypothetical protein